MFESVKRLKKRKNQKSLKKEKIKMNGGVFFRRSAFIFDAIENNCFVKERKIAPRSRKSLLFSLRFAILNKTKNPMASLSGGSGRRREQKLLANSFFRIKLRRKSSGAKGPA